MGKGEGWRAWHGPYRSRRKRRLFHAKVGRTPEDGDAGGVTLPGAALRGINRANPTMEARMSRIIDLSLPIANHFRWPVERSVKGELIRMSESILTCC